MDALDLNHTTINASASSFYMLTAFMHINNADTVYIIDTKPLATKEGARKEMAQRLKRMGFGINLDINDFLNGVTVKLPLSCTAYSFEDMSASYTSENGTVFKWIITEIKI